jgi:alpha-beta hydrolase superfamily lysophospholipase
MKQEFEIELNNKKKVYCKSWFTKNDQTKGVIFAIHGLNEHINRYDSLFERFCEAGFDVHGFDLPGHGRTFEANSNQDELTDFSLVTEIIEALMKKNTKSVPNILFGHSMGGLLGLYVLDKMHDLFNYAIIQGAAIRPYQQVPYLKEKIGSFMSSLLPTLRIPSGLDIDSFSSNKKAIEDYKNDKYVRTGISLILGSNLLKTGQYFINKKFEWNNVKVLILHGSKDTATCCVATEEFAKLNNFRWLLKEGWYHELHHDNQDEIFSDYMSFLNE